jgi:hypothetical protein
MTASQWVRKEIFRPPVFGKKTFGTPIILGVSNQTRKTVFFYFPILSVPFSLLSEKLNEPILSGASMG